MASSRSSVLSPAVPDLLGCEVPRVFTPPLRPLTPKTSLGFALIEFARDVLGINLHPWQQWLAIHALELLPDGSFRFRTIVLLVARQNGKSTFLQVLSLFFLYVRGVALVIGTAQSLDIAEEVWQGAVDMAQDVPDLAAEIERVVMVNGKKALELRHGERYKVQAASRRGGRGLSGDLVLLDELREHQNWEAWSAVTKTTMARPLAQVWAASNAGDKRSVVLAHLRGIGHAAVGNPDEIPGLPDVGAGDESLGLFEWSAAPGCDLHDPEGIAQGNPSLGYGQLTLRAIKSALVTDPESVYRTEVLCQWVDRLSDPVLPLDLWSSLTRPDVEMSEPVSFSLEVALGRDSACVGVAWQGKDHPHVVLAKQAAGTDWIVPYLSAACTKRQGTVTLDGATEAGSFVDKLEAEGIKVTVVKGADRPAVCSGLFDAVAQAAVTHDGDPAVLAAISGATWRQTAEGARTFARKGATDIAPLYAVALALHGVDQSFDVAEAVW